MEPYEDEQFHENGDGNSAEESRGTANRWLTIALVVLLGAAGLATTYGVRERYLAEQLKEQAATTNAAMSQLQAQVSTLTGKLNDINTPQAGGSNSVAAAPPIAAESADTSEAVAPVTAPAGTTPPAASTPVAPVKSAPAKHATTAKKRAPVDKRYSQLKAQLDAQGKQLKETQDQVAKNRADLEGSISSTREELNGSIAKTHEELVALEKRGERNYYEFDLSKGKQFQRVGPMTLSLRKTDTKHKSYDLAMIVDDNELSKKKVNLYEPIWLHTESGGQPVQVVVNRIDKNMVHGYVSAPKYKESELAVASPTNVSAPASGSANPPVTTRPQ